MTIVVRSGVGTAFYACQNKRKASKEVYSASNDRVCQQQQTQNRRKHHIQNNAQLDRGQRFVHGFDQR